MGRKIGVMQVLAFSTALLGGIPFVAYGWGRVTGSIPGEGIWPKIVGNHGPWWDSWMGLFLLFSFLTLLILPIITLIAALVLFIRQRRSVVILQGIGLAITECGLAYAQFWLLLWMID